MVAIFSFIELIFKNPFKLFLLKIIFNLVSKSAALWKDTIIEEILFFVN